MNSSWDARFDTACKTLIVHKDSFNVRILQDWTTFRWSIITLLSDHPAAKLIRMKVHVFSDFTLCVGVSNPDPYNNWATKLEDVRNEHGFCRKFEVGTLRSAIYLARTARCFSMPRNSQSSRLQAVLTDHVKMGPVTGIETSRRSYDTQVIMNPTEQYDVIMFRHAWKTLSKLSSGTKKIGLTHAVVLPTKRNDYSHSCSTKATVMVPTSVEQFSLKEVLLSWKNTFSTRAGVPTFNQSKTTVYGQEDSV